MTCDSAKSEDKLWLACAIANSKFIETYYDKMFNNKLYAGRRRFITQYVERFPLPDPESGIGREIISKARDIFDSVETPEAPKLAAELEGLVGRAFGHRFEEPRREADLELLVEDLALELRKPGEEVLAMRS